MSVKCLSSHGSLFAIKAEEFSHKMQKDGNTWRQLNKLASEKDQRFEEAIWRSTLNMSLF
jgi:hypothetical protein